MDEFAARLLIADHLGVLPALVADGAALTDLGADPLDIVALILRMERTFAIRISDESGEGCVTVGDLIVSGRQASQRRNEPAAVGTRRWARP